jgi:hypothetical protein
MNLANPEGWSRALAADMNTVYTEALMLTFGLILAALAALGGLALAAVRARRDEYLLVLRVHAGETFFFERQESGRYDPIAAWQLPLAAARYAMRTPSVRRPVLRTPRTAPALARS